MMATRSQQVKLLRLFIYLFIFKKGGVSPVLGRPSSIHCESAEVDLSPIKVGEGNKNVDFVSQFWQLVGSSHAGQVQTCTDGSVFKIIKRSCNNHRVQI